MGYVKLMISGTDHLKLGTLIQYFDKQFNIQYPKIGMIQNGTHSESFITFSWTMQRNDLRDCSFILGPCIPQKQFFDKQWNL